MESIRDFVQIQLDKIDTKRGCKTRASITLVGGYRRGKTESNDCDLLITYPEADGAEIGVLADLLDRLKFKGEVPQIRFVLQPQSNVHGIATTSRSRTGRWCLVILRGSLEASFGLESSSFCFGFA